MKFTIEIDESVAAAICERHGAENSPEGMAQLIQYTLGIEAKNALTEQKQKAAAEVIAAEVSEALNGTFGVKSE